jgi:phosphatidylglycerol:prolipoprotein diacylglycerol transferase
MHPILATFTLGGTTVVLRAYSTFYVLAWVVATVLATAVAGRRGISWRRSLATFALALAVGVVGARLLDLAVNWGYYAEDTSRIYDLGFRGFSLYGGLILALITAVLLTRAFRLPLWRLADGAVPALAAGIVLMRTGCFLNGCCFGTATSLPWGVTYPAGGEARGAVWAHQLLTGKTGILGLAGGVRPVHPTQVYEMIAAMLLCGFAVWLLRRRDPSGEPRTSSGVPFLAFALGFTLFRLGDHFLRAKPVTIAVPPWFYPLLYSLIVLGVAGVLIWRKSHFRRAAPSNKGD